MSHSDLIAEYKLGNIRSMAATEQRLMPVSDPVASLRAGYAGMISDSDLFSLITLAEQGKLEVMLNRDTRAINLVPAAETERLVNLIFDLPDD